MAADRRLQTVVYAQPNLTELIDDDVMLFFGGRGRCVKEVIETPFH